MLTKTVYVRRLSPIDNEEYQKNPTGYTGQWTTNEDGEIGEIVSEHFIPVPDSENSGLVKMTPVVGVCWDENRIPAIQYESLAFLERIDLSDDEDFEDFDFGEEEAEGDTNVVQD